MRDCIYVYIYIYRIYIYVALRLSSFCVCFGGAYLRVAIFWKLNLNFYVLAFSCLLSYALTLAGSMAFVAACSLF